MTRALSVSLRVLVGRVPSLIRVLVEGIALVEDSASFPRKFLTRKVILRFWPRHETRWK